MKSKYDGINPSEKVVTTRVSIDQVELRAGEYIGISIRPRKDYFAEYAYLEILITTDGEVIIRGTNYLEDRPIGKFNEDGL